MNNKQTINVTTLHSGQRQKYGDSYAEGSIEFIDSKMNDETKKDKAARIWWALKMHGSTIRGWNDKREWHEAYVSKTEVKADGTVFVQITQPSTH